jgi:hypothetical protein
MIQEMHRAPRPGGAAILMAVNRRSWLRAMYRLARVDGLVALPRAWVCRYGHRLMAFATKAGDLPERAESRR